MKSKPGRSRLTVTVVRLDGRRAVRNIRTPPNQFFTPAGVEEQLKFEADRVENYFPGLEFRLVPLRDGNFNFVEVPPPELTAQPGTECAEMEPASVPSAVGF
jgi:hypothetical protein